MNELVLVGGPAGPNLVSLGAELAARDGTRASNFRCAAFLTRLREATLHRATVWQGVSATGATWIEPAVRRMGALLAESLTAGARWTIDVHVDNACELELLADALPHARFVLLLRDGRFAPAPIDSPLAALEWARAWARATSGVVRRGSALGARACVVRDERLVADPAREFAGVAAALRMDTPAEWSGPSPQSAHELRADLLECFAAHGPARELSARLGYELPTPERECDKTPEVALEWVRALLALERLEDARAHAERSLALQPSAAGYEALGLVEQRAGRQTASVHAFLRAIQHDAARVGPWRELFAQPQRPELAALAEFARISPQVQVRSILARWLVTRGLDREAAEIVANVAHQPWQQD